MGYRINLLFIFFLFFIEVNLFAQITIHKPKKNDIINYEDLVEITWTSKGTTEKVKIEYKLHNDWILIDTEGAGVGSYFWYVPNIFIDDRVFVIRVKSVSYSWKKDEVYLILAERRSSYYKDKYFLFEQYDNVRSGPSTDYPVIATTSPNTYIDVISFKDNWYEVYYPDGTVGYTHNSNGKIINKNKTNTATPYPSSEGESGWLLLGCVAILLLVLAAN